MEKYQTGPSLAGNIFSSEMRDGSRGKKALTRKHINAKVQAN